ncbi:MAG: serine hydrolase domain-containing protein [Mangrovibacterium sp.]
MKKTVVLSVFLYFVLLVQAQKNNNSIVNAMQPYVDSGDIPGIYYLVADADKILEKGGVGYADIEKRKKMDEEVLFWIASQSKPFASVAVMILVDEGKLALDVPVTNYLPELDHLMVRVLDRDSVEVLEHIKRPVTLRHLLSHTSGMQFVGGVQQQFGKIDVLPLNNSVYVSNMTPLLFQPGENFSYSNQGINITASAVERVSGMPYEEFLQKRIFDPLDMKDITFWPTGKQMEKMAIPYRKVDNKLVATVIGQLQYPLNDRTKRFAEPGGGLFCTPACLVKFYQMIATREFTAEKGL